MKRLPTTLLLGLIVTVVFLSAIYIFTSLPRRGEVQEPLLLQSTSYEGSDKCATCHKRASPDIVYQYATSAMARAGVRCIDCHVVDKNNPMGKDHEGFFITSKPTPRQCQRCHPSETNQYNLSRHSAPSWIALSGLDDFSPEQRKLVDRISEANRDVNGIITATRNSLFDIEGPAVTPGACQSCHSIGKPNKDGSIGNCNKCHLRHEFSIEQVRKPEICGQCHLGPDHPQKEIYDESAHGVMYATQGGKWNWNQRPGRLTTTDMPAPTCATCHMSGFGPEGTTHDVGLRLSKFLFAAITKDRPNALQGREAMKAICSSCHTKSLIETQYAQADSITAFVSERVEEASKILDGLVKDGIIPNTPFATQISYEAFDLWHYYGRTAKFGAYMQGPDFVQWHGIYPLLKQLNQVKADERILRAEHRKGEKR